MQLRHACTLLPASRPGTYSCDAKITAICFSPNNRKLAVCAMDRVVRLFNDEGDAMDKFSTKSADKGPRTFVVRSMIFSPDSIKLAVGQSDNVVFVYKIGLEWGKKKSICNKFLQASPVTCLTWPSAHVHEIVYGLAEGQVKIGQIRSNKAATLYATNSYVCAIASSTNGRGVCSSHVDGSIHCVLVHEANRTISNTKIVKHSCTPYAIAWGHSLVVGGIDGSVVFYDPSGIVQQRFDCKQESDDASKNDSNLTVNEFTLAAFNATGETVVLGNWDHFVVYTYRLHYATWEEIPSKKIDRLYAVTAMSWKNDGTRLATGSLFGALDVYDACVRRFRYKGKFEFTYASLSQVIVKRVDTGLRIVLKSVHACEIMRINIFHDRYVVANTLDSKSNTETLLLGDLVTYKLSEIQWSNGGFEKFVFDNPRFCMVYQAGELILIEYGCNETMGSVTTDFFSGHVLSFRTEFYCGTAEGGLCPRYRKIAYLMDSQTIGLKDLVSGSLTSIFHDCTVDWLELNGRASWLLYRDRRHKLNLYNVDAQSRVTLIDYCTYVQWVPDSNVVVAQSRHNLCVWYNIHVPDQVTIHSIQGDIEDVECIDGITEVIVREQLSRASYLLDETLIEFGKAVDNHSFNPAAEILETLELSLEAVGMWAKLEQLASSNQDFHNSGRCAAALGNVARARYLHKLSKVLSDRDSDVQSYGERAKYALMCKDLNNAENVFFSLGRFHDAVKMHQNFHNFDRAVVIAEEKAHPAASNMRRAYLHYLVASKQELRAAQLKESEGAVLRAIELYLLVGLASRAAKLVKRYDIKNPLTLLERISQALTSMKLYELAGDIYERAGQLEHALESYIQGSIFCKSVELARARFPARVVELQEAWGDFLYENDLAEMAVNHYIEASLGNKAIKASIASRQWMRASQMLDSIPLEVAKPYLTQLAKHYDASGDLSCAKKFYVAAGTYVDGVDMYMRFNQWEEAHKMASSHLTSDEMKVLYVARAQELEGLGKLKEAERLYVLVGEYNLAINMYKKHHQYDATIKLVERYRKDLLNETHQYVGQQLEAKGSLRDAEQHYCQSGEWLSAVNMFRTNDMWPEALRVARLHGGVNACKRVAYAWALSLGGDAGAHLSQQGLIEPAIDYAIELGAFKHAFELAHGGCPAKLFEVHLKHALHLEDEERYKEAETEFIKANKPREAIDMYIHQHAWNDALSVAATHDPSASAHVYIAHARVEADVGQYQRAEDLYLLAAKPEQALAMYREAGLWDEALKVAERHLPHQMVEISRACAKVNENECSTKEDFLAAGQRWEAKQEWEKAVSAYLMVHPSGFVHADNVEEVLYAAVNVAQNHLPLLRRECVITDVIRRLRALKRYEVAAELLRESSKIEEAVSCAIEGECWTKARELATGISAMEAQVDSAYRAALRESNDSDGLFRLGDSGLALDVLADQNEWDKLWRLVDQKRVDSITVAKYAACQAMQSLTEQGNRGVDAALTVLRKRAAPSPFLYTDLYQKLAILLIGQDSTHDREDPVACKANASLFRDLLHHLGTSDGSTANKILQCQHQHAFYRVLMAVHYFTIYLTTVWCGLKTIALKASITLLRYPDIVPLDKAFYQAGVLARDLGHMQLAFFFLNRYIDVTDAIENPSLTRIDKADFPAATSIPCSFDVPCRQYIVNSDEREEIRDWVLSLCIDKSIDRELPASNDAIGTVYGGLYLCDHAQCIVTGNPIKPSETLSVNGYAASKSDWNSYVRAEKKCPWTNEPQGPLY